MNLSAAAVVAAERLSAAFAARNVDAALDCFVTDDDIAYAGSEQTATRDSRLTSAATNSPRLHG